MVGGGILTALMLTPMIAYFGEGLPGVLPPGQQRISAMSPAPDLRPVRPVHRRGGRGDGRHPQHAQRPAADPRRRSPAAWARSRGQGTGGRRRERLSKDTETPRTDRDIPMPLVLLGSVGLVAAVAASNLIPTDTIGRVDRRRDGGPLRLSVRDGELADHRRDRLVVEPDLGHDDRDPAAHLPDLRRPGLGRSGVPAGRPLDRRRGLHRLVERRHDLAGPQDRIPRRRDAVEAAGVDPRRRPGLGGGHGGSRCSG